jgi:hypothetical protein
MSIRETVEYIKEFEEKFQLAMANDKKEFTIEEKVDFMLERMCAIDTIMPMLVEYIESKDPVEGRKRRRK